MLQVVVCGSHWAESLSIPVYARPGEPRMVASRYPRRWIALLVGLVCCVLPGCVARRYTIRTEPPGALAIVNGQEMGVTPVSSSFEYYGDREIVLIKDGFETQRVIQPIKSPWWDNHLTEFFSENLVPVVLRDDRDFTYKLNPPQVPQTSDLLQRAEALRVQGQVAPPPRRGGILGFLGF